MILVNGEPITVTTFPDGTSQVWKLTPAQLVPKAEVSWRFESEAEVMHLAQLSLLLSELDIFARLDIRCLPYARQDKDVANDRTFALYAFAPIGASVPATEHSVQCVYGDDDAYVRDMITKVHPSGIVSVVSDGYDFWDVITRVVPSLKSEIMARDGKLVIRPDSGDPVKIVCGDPEATEEHVRKGAIECLWDIFGGTVSPQGFRCLDSHIGLIYGDAITLERASRILSLLRTKGFASTNVVFGIGSYTYQYNTRDTFGMALKSTLAVRDGKEVPIFKTPKTDNGLKYSQRGRVVVERNAAGSITWRDGLSLTDHVPTNLLKDRFVDGKMVNETTFADVRDRVKAT